MSGRRTTILLEDVTIEFPRTRLALQRVEKSIATMLGFGRKRPHFTALQRVSLDVKEGEVIGLIGRNGAGKSTLLRVIAGIYRPNRGSAKVAGHVSLLAGLGVGFNVNLSGRDNVYLYGSILGRPRKVMDALMDEIITFSELEEFIDEPLRTYSSGMRARLGFAVATATDPEILLIDEALSVGDNEFKERSSARIQQIMRQAATVVIASHGFGVLRDLCQRVIHMERGQIIRVGPPDEVIAAYLGKAKLPPLPAREQAAALRSAK